MKYNQIVSSMFFLKVYDLNSVSRKWAVLSICLLSLLNHFCCEAAKMDSLYENNIVVINKGIGGNTTRDLLLRIKVDVLDHNPDLVILMVGTNDMLNSKKMLTYQDYETNLDEIVREIMAIGSKLMIISSPTVDSSYLFLRHDPDLFKDASPNTKIDSVRQIAKRTAMNHGAYFFDLNAVFKTLNLPQHNQDLFIKNQRNSGVKDGVHPTALGYRFIAENVFLFLNQNQLLQAGMKIICFGDSITRGESSNNKGSALGQNYPVFLSERINGK